MHGDIFKDESINSATFNMELFAAIGSGRVYNQQTVVFACCCGKSTNFTGKIKSDENGHALKVASDTTSCFVDISLHFFENANYFLFHFEH